MPARVVQGMFSITQAEQTTPSLGEYLAFGFPREAGLDAKSVGEEQKHRCSSAVVAAPV